MAEALQAERPILIDDAAEYLSVSVRTLERLATSQRLRVIRIGSKRYLPAAELRRVMAEGTSRNGP